jgi:hypothetical protein
VSYMLALAALGLLVFLAAPHRPTALSGLGAVRKDGVPSLGAPSLGAPARSRSEARKVEGGSEILKSQYTVTLLHK